VSWGFVARNIFGVFIENKSDINLSKILEDRAIISLPWFMGKQNAKVSDDFENHLVDSEEYRNAKIKHENELKRLLYVGMTRARDYLVSSNINGHKAFPWIDVLSPNHKFKTKYENVTETIVDDLYGVKKDVLIHKLSLSDEHRIESKETNQYFAGKEINAERESVPYFISPSKIDALPNIKVSLFADIQNRIPIGSSAKDKVDVLGNCLHDILNFYIGAILNNSTNDSLITIDNLIVNHEMKEVIDASEVKASIDKIYAYLTETFKPVQWHRELALESEINGQLYKGEADLVLETESGYILIDYKSFPGQFDRVLDDSTSNYAGKYSGQLDAYAKMIECNTDKKVLKRLIYYTVHGKFVEVYI
jgi:ATP-dependent exoDNAse (exonuclease V) beta subunit